MVRTVRLSGWLGLAALLSIATLIALSLPLFLILIAGVLVTSAVRRAFTALPDDVIKNKRIGPYRIKSDPNDPNVIEVSDA